MCHNPLNRVTCKITQNVEIASDIFDMIVEVGGMADIALPGQFANLYCADSAKLLPRPISICNVDRDNQTLRLIYAVVGEGTKDFAKLIAGDSIEILGPLGKGFTLDGHMDSHVLIVGGGVGTPPLLQLAKTLKEKYADKITITIVLGFRDDIYLSEEFKAYGQIYVGTDSGKHGYKGNVIQLMSDVEVFETNDSFDYMFSCGPTPMLKGLQQYVHTKGIKGEFSLEERMGCGFGGCVGCVVGIRNADTMSETVMKSKDDIEANEFEYKKVCKDGPVFEYSEVIF